MSTPALSRRGFLAAGAATCAAVSPLAAFAREAAAADLNLGIQLYSLRGYKVDEAMKHARDIGFRFVEFYGDMFPVNSDAAAIAAMKKKLADLGLTASAHGVNGFGGDAAANRKVFEFAKAAGIPCISADPSPEAFKSLDLEAVPLAIEHRERMQRVALLLHERASGVGIEPAAEEQHRTGTRHRRQTPLVSGDQMSLCTCSCTRAGSRSARTQAASSAGGNTPWTGDRWIAAARPASPCRAITSRAYS